MPRKPRKFCDRHYVITMTHKVTALLLLSLGMALNAASAASFDCNKAAAPMEKRICANPQISTLDDQLSAAYRKVLNISPAAEDTKEQQREWVRSTRNPCKTDLCVLNAYMARIVELETQAKRLPFLPSLQKPVALLSAEDAEVVEQEIAAGFKPIRVEDIELIGRVRFNHDRAGGKYEIVVGKTSYTLRYVWQISDEVKIFLDTKADSNDYLLVRGKIATFIDGSRKFDDRVGTEIFAQ